MLLLSIKSDQSCEQFQFSTLGELISHRVFSTIMDCPKPTQDEAVIILLSGEHITLHEIKLPRMRTRERLRAIPFALEEQLASDPDSIGIALGEVKPTGELTVAVFEKQFLEAQIAACKVATVTPSVMMPDYLAIAYHPNAWTIVLEKNHAMIRIDRDHGFSTESDNLNILLELLLSTNANKKPEKIICYNTPQDANADIVKALVRLPVPIEIRFSDDFSYLDFAMFLQKPVMNMLQGTYRPRMKFFLPRKKWMPCLIAAATWITFLWFSNITQWIYFHHEMAKINQQVLLSYQTLFPGARVVIAPHFRTENLLKKYNNASKNILFLKLLGIAGKTVLQFPSIVVTAMHYRHHTLIFTIEMPNATALNPWLLQLRQQGLDATAQGADIIITEPSVKAVPAMRAHS